MSVPQTVEEVLLRPAEKYIRQCLDECLNGASDERCHEARTQMLEAAAALIGGFDFDWYQSYCGHMDVVPGYSPTMYATHLVGLLQRLPFNPSLALASLARPELSRAEQRTEGAYFTDFRLALALAKRFELSAPLRTVLDPACGSGSLLVASSLVLCGGNKRRTSKLLAESICACDKSERALRGAGLALASLTNDKAVIRELRTRLRRADSLETGITTWRDLAVGGFDLVIGNPPWEKLKLTRHEFLLSKGAPRHYGANYLDLPNSDFGGAKRELDRYAASVLSSFQLQGRGEADLYKLFVELSLGLVRPGGQLALVLPAGLIRSLGTMDLRKALIKGCSSVDLTVFENRARFFSIDTRFKFLFLHATVANGHPYKAITLRHGRGTNLGVNLSNRVVIPRAVLRELRPDYSLPEVRNPSEWALFRELGRCATQFGDLKGRWRPSLMREVDMTRDKIDFRAAAARHVVPLIEGRMVHQYRHAAKRYISGTGRSAIWAPTVEAADCEMRPQFWYPADKLPNAVRTRVSLSRVGFCDITGQTNERTILAARVPAGVVCGNKVPTIIFPDAGSKERSLADAWLAIANSFLFDWLARRIVTTTVNFFLLLGLPMPDLAVDEENAKRLSWLASQIGACRHEPVTVGSERSNWQSAEMRAETEWRVLQLYGQGVEALKLILTDFPLLDRSQTPLPGEDRSTITRDLVFLRAAENLGGAKRSELIESARRVREGKEVGAVPYVPSFIDQPSDA
jgi:hypothetical protein